MKQTILSVLLFAASVSYVLGAQNKTEKLDKLMKAYYETERFMGTVLVAENGKILYQKGFGSANIEWKIPNSPSGEFRIASITKTFTGLLTMQLIQEGQLKLETKISEILPYYRKDIGQRITVHHLLTHSSGIPNYLQIPGFVPEKIRIPLNSVEDFVKNYCSNDLQFEPGTKFTYNNSGYAILGAIIEKVTGQTFEQVLKAKILDPAGMTHTGLDKNEIVIPERVTGYVRNLDGTFQHAIYWDMSTAYTAGQMYSTVGDMLKYHEALLGEKLLKKEYKDLMFTKYYPAFGHHYGYGWMIRDMDVKAGSKPLMICSHEGGIPGFNLYFARIPEKNQVAVIFNNTSDAPLKEISNSIFSILNGVDYKTPKPSLARSFLKELLKNGTETALQYYQAKKKNAPAEFEIAESELNRAGYDLMGRHKLNEAVAVFKLMTEEFPNSGNAFDSLAEGYMNMGQKEKAIENYQKSLELDPSNVNAVEMIKKIKSM